MVRFIYLCQLCVVAELSELHKCLQKLHCLHFVNCEKGIYTKPEETEAAKNLFL